MIQKIDRFLEWVAQGGIGPLTSPHVAQKIRTANVSTVVFACILSAYIALFFALRRPDVAITAIPYVVAYFGALTLSRYGFHKVGRTCTVLIFNTVVYVYSAAFGQDTSVHFWFVPAAFTPLLFFAFEEKRPLFFSMTASVTTFLFLWRTQFAHPLLITAPLDSAYTYRLSITMIGGAFVTAFFMILYVVSQYERMLNAKIQADLAIVHASKLASLGEMCGGIAHEINNPMGVIQGKSKQLLKQIQAGSFSPEKCTEQLEKIISETNRITAIIKGLRAFARDGEKDPFLPIGIEVLFNDVLALCSERFKHHAVELMVSERPQIPIECRSVQIAQVLTNLLNNAFDAVLPLPEKWVRVAIEPREGNVAISVTDSGTGIPAHVADKLMQPFFTTKEIGKGTGLGLSISRGIIEDHGGKLWLDRNSKHTRFVIELPTKQKLRTAA